MKKLSFILFALILIGCERDDPANPSATYDFAGIWYEAISYTADDGTVYRQELSNNYLKTDFHLDKYSSNFRWSRSRI